MADIENIQLVENIASDAEVAQQQEEGARGHRFVRLTIALTFAALAFAGVAFGTWRVSSSSPITSIGSSKEALRLYDDCGQDQVCTLNLQNPMGYTFCPYISGKNCPCGSCCSINPNITACQSGGGGGGGSDDDDSNGAACFPGEARVQVLGSDAAMKIESLRVGDFVLAESRADGSQVFEEVLGFLHRVPGARAQYLSVQLEGGEMRVSPKHLVFLEGQRGVREEKFAESLQPGDQLAVAPGHAGRVLSLRRGVEGRGWYAPLTASGTVVVDSVLASNYANVKAHHAAHAAFFPARAYHKIAGAVAAAFGASEVTPWKPESEEAMHPLAAALRPLEALLPKVK